jgi:hypothetical protein
MAFCDGNFWDGSNYFWNFNYFNDFDYHSVCPTGRLGAARTPSSGTWKDETFVLEIHLGDELFFTS